MLVSYKWLQEYVNISIDAYQLAEKLTAAGVTVDNVYDLNIGLDNCVVGYLHDVVKHHNSDRLWICKVDVGDEILQIVTGAQNVRKGQLVPVAKVGANLPNGVKIKKSRLRGEDSCGMLISLDELGYDSKVMKAEEKEGIYILPDGSAKKGDSLAQVLDRDDFLLELDLTPNRADCNSMLGLAYEVATLLDSEVILPKYYTDDGDDVSKKITIDIEADDLCPQYSARILNNITETSTPLWMQNRLRHTGMRPISLIVDIANYVMIEIGQPLHTFDYDKIANKHIIVRRAYAGEKICTLDEVERTLSDKDLVIADEEHAIAVAGVMGGHDSEFSSKTNTILLESASFKGTNVRRTSRSLGLASEAASRFSKGIEQARILPALNRFAYLAKELRVANVVSGIVSNIKKQESAKQISLRPQRVSLIAGDEIPVDEMVVYLKKLGFTVSNEKGALSVIVPSRRPDIVSEIDLVEEILRLRGFDKLKSTEPKIKSSGFLPSYIKLRRVVREVLRAAGTNEIVSYAFHSPDELDLLLLSECDPLRQVIKIQNPLSSMQSIMRTSMLPGMLRAAVYNLNRQRQGVLISETGRVFHNVSSNQLPNEYEMVGILAAGVSESKQWYGQKEKVHSFYSVKGIVEAIFNRLHLEVKFERLSRPYLHPGRAAQIICQGQIMGYLGEIHPDVTDGLGVESDARFVFSELNLHELNKLTTGISTFSEIKPYPAVDRDLAIVVNQDKPVAEMIKLIKEAAGNLLEDVRVFDVYSGHQVGEDKKSCAFTLRYQAKDKTLTADEINAVHTRVIEKLENALDAILR